MSYRELVEARMKSSLGPDRKLLCKKCLIEQEVYPGAGHPENCVDLHCVACGSFVTRMIKGPDGKLKLDTSVYGKKIGTDGKPIMSGPNTYKLKGKKRR